MRSLAHPWRLSQAAIATGIIALSTSVALAVDRQSLKPSAAPPAVTLPQVLDVQHGKAEKGFRLFYPDGWSTDSQRYRNATEMNAFPQGAPAEQRRGAARLLVIVEQRRSEQDALNRLQGYIPAGGTIEVSTFEIDGWPAVAKTWNEPPKRRGIKSGDPEYTANWLFTSVAVAVGDTFVRFEAQIPSGDRAMRDLVHQIARSTRWMSKGDPAKAEAELERIRASRPAKQPAAAGGAGPTEEASIEQLLAEGEATMGLVRDTVNTFSEIEVAVSADGRDVVIGTNGRYATSNDGGQTFVTANLAPAYPRNGDPSLGFGQSKSFYYGFIAYPDGTGGTGNDVNGCTSGIMRSTDRGLTFTHRGHAAWCQRNFDTCFPDQEHIAVDRWNPSASSQDQLYNSWRNFTNDAADKNCDQLGGGYVDVLLTCSVDGGAHWNNGGPASIATTGSDPQGAAPVVVTTTGDLPRITVGQDGWIYVTYLDNYNGNFYPDIMVAKYSSCASGLQLAGGFPIVAASSVWPIACPVPGLDRCNDGNDLRSPTLAVDDLDPSHVSVSFATAASFLSPTRHVVALVDSTDYGYNWSSPVILNNGYSTQRFMPWSCSVCGETFVGWYDRRSSTVLDNSLTDFYLGRAKRDPVDGLLAGQELRVSPTPDSQCGPPGDPTHWCAPRSPNDSDACTQQPQLAGNCVDDNATPGNAADDISQNIRCDFSSCGGANTNITFPDGDSDPADICACTAWGAGHEVQCRNGGGCPMYGDYNGIACAAGRVYATWASATPPGGPQDPDAIRTFALVKLFGCEAQIQVPSGVHFEGSCNGTSIRGELNICNTGKADLEVDAINSSDPQFAVTTPSAGYPVVVSPDFCFPFEVVFDPLTANSGLQTATLTIVNNDPLSPDLELAVEASTEAGEPNIATTFVASNDFGTVCIGATKEFDLTIHNSGGCALSISAIASDNTQFKVGAVSGFPLVVEPGDTVAVPLRFQPTTSTGAKSADLTITSNDPDTPTKHLTLAGTGGAATLDMFVANNGSFGKVCAGDFRDLDVTLQNNGVCPLFVTETEFDDGAGNFALPSGVNGTKLEPMNSVLFPVRFAPTSFMPLSPRSTDFVIYGGTLGTPPILDDGVSISGTVPPPDINVSATTTTVELGNVCADESKEIDVPVCNVGPCNLNVTSAALINGCLDFEVVQNPFPSIVSKDFCMSVKVRYTPTSEGSHSCTLRILSDDPDEGSVDVIVHATTPLTNIDIPPSQSFLPEVVSAVDVCESRLPFPISNNGLCPINIANVSIPINDAEFAVEAAPSFVTPLQPGQILGDGDLRIVYAPDLPLTREELGTVRVTYETDAITHATTDVDRKLCGEAVLTGARVLVTYNGANVDWPVDRIQIQRVVGNRNRRPQLDTVSIHKNVPLIFMDRADEACTDYYFHQEYGGYSNPIQLVPGYYQVTATITVDGRRRTKTVAFSVNACDFNPSVIVAF